jgi:hypothetical protein
MGRPRTTIRVEEAAAAAGTRAFTVDAATLATFGRGGELPTVWGAFYDWIEASGFASRGNGRRFLERVRVGSGLMNKLRRAEQARIHRVFGLRGHDLAWNVSISNMNCGPLEQSPEGLRLTGDGFYVT